MPAPRRRSRVFSISMPADMAKEALSVAKEQNRTMSELMREAFRVYEERRVARFFDEMRGYARTRNARGYTEDDIPGLIAEVRAARKTERQPGKRKLG